MISAFFFSLSSGMMSIADIFNRLEVSIYMNQAKSGNEIVHLHTVSAGELQTLFEKGKRDQLSCIICHKPVKLFIGIHETPYFLS
ncbi:hypothetical protein RCO48_02225 [Peribacillus frigoritolerans]|nr:hypothetical protein [Peribacillus frigoritolerans]